MRLPLTPGVTCDAVRLREKRGIDQIVACVQQLEAVGRRTIGFRALNERRLFRGIDDHQTIEPTVTIHQQKARRVVGQVILDELVTRPQILEQVLDRAVAKQRRHLDIEDIAGRGEGVENMGMLQLANRTVEQFVDAVFVLADETIDHAIVEGIHGLGLGRHPGKKNLLDMRIADLAAEIQAIHLRHRIVDHGDRDLREPVGEVHFPCERRRIEADFAMTGRTHDISPRTPAIEIEEALS